MFGSFGGALSKGSLTFVSQAGLQAGIGERYGLAKPLSAVKNIRGVRKQDMVHNAYAPRMEVDPQTYVVRADGQPLPNAPEYNVDFTARYEHPLANGGALFAATDWNVQGYTNYVLYKTREFYSEGNFEGGLKLGYTAPGGAYEVALFGRNITNEKNLKGVIENYMASVFNEPRIVGVSVSAKLR